MQHENFYKAIMFRKRFSSFLGFFESLLSVNQQQPLLLTGEFSTQCNTTNLTKRSHFFHPSLNRLRLSWIKINKISAFKLNSFAFHFRFQLLFGHGFHVCYQTMCACHVFNLLCNRRFYRSVLLFSVFDATCADLLKFSSPWLILRFLRLYTFNFVYKKQRISIQKRVDFTYANSLYGKYKSTDSQAHLLTSWFNILKIVSIQFLH